MLKIRADKGPYFRKRISLLICEEDTRGQVTAIVKGPLTLHSVTPSEMCCETSDNDILSLEPEAAEQLMDELWACGIRPSNGEGSTGQLAAVNRHLEDMKKLVFDYSVQKREE